MCTSRNPIQCIIPPHILDALLASHDASVRESALATIKLSSFIRGRRSVLGNVLAAVPGGTHVGINRTIFDSHHTEDDPPSGTTVRTEGQAPTGNAAVDEAYDGLGDTYKFYSEVFQRNSIDGHGLPLVAYVHYGNQFNNAFWDGAEMVFGDGDGIIFRGFTRSLDVIGHELAHGVTERTAGLEYHRQPGALNESFSDVFGSLIKQYKLGQTAATADWLIGAEILGPGIHGRALRSMADPGSAYDDPRLGGRDPQPKHMDDFANLPDTRPGDFGGVHVNSGIPNHAFYLVATQLGGNAWDAAGHIWYSTLLQLGPTSQFRNCAEVSAQVAGTLYGTGSREQQVVRDAWEAVGLTVSSNGAVPPVRRRAGRTRGIEQDAVVLKRQLERLAQELQSTIEVLN